MRLIKYIAVLLLALCASPRILNAQTLYESRVTIGGKAGMTMSRVMFSPSVPQTMLMGYMAGVAFRYAEEKNFGLLAELNIAQRGWKEDFEEAPFEYSRKLTYVQVPIMTHIFFGNSKMRGFFNAGPEIGFMIGESTSANFDVNNIKNIQGFPIINRYNDQLTLPVKNKIDYGISVGAGMEFIAKRKHSFLLEGRFYYGLGNVFGSRKRDAFSASTGMSLMVTLGYMYRLK